MNLQIVLWSTVGHHNSLYIWDNSLWSLRCFRVCPGYYECTHCFWKKNKPISTRKLWSSPIHIGPVGHILDQLVTSICAGFFFFLILKFWLGNIQKNLTTSYKRKTKKKYEEIQSSTIGLELINLNYFYAHLSKWGR